MVVAVVGEALIDLIQEADGRYRPTPGGAPANVAIALTRLGINTRFFGRLGNDRFGALVGENLRRNGVALDDCVQASEPTSVAVANRGQGGAAEYSFYINGTADWQWTDAELAALGKGARALHLGSLAAIMEPGASVIAEHVEKIFAAGKTLISFDLNLQPSLGVSREREHERVSRLVASAHIVKTSVGDLRWLYPDRLPGEVAEIWSRSRAVVLTRGGDGVSLYRPGVRPVDVPARPTTVVDTVAAGDTFVAALLYRLLSGVGKDPAALLRQGPTEWIEHLRFANAAASLACEWPGANPPMLSEVNRAFDGN
ncbi:carbohydrate kinase [Mycetocola lacteus]|uniref:Carbohydrate kinase n=1 Tax=Mycetocola lacteus TaxID=76637 RepID=A0A3L7AN28_9MICO|nr:MULTISPECIES: carbohydrate kinase [Mycetocola]MCS4275685.1 fructokinase [Mycetocola sp. BIGb0189]RLP81375.1 carbohydrate kinase [Mycetocola lacteus]